MDFDTEVKLAIYRHIAENADMPTIDIIALALNARASEIQSAYLRLFEKRVLVLDPEGEGIRMAPPFSGIETQHLGVGRESLTPALFLLVSDSVTFRRRAAAATSRLSARERGRECGRGRRGLGSWCAASS